MANGERHDNDSAVLRSVVQAGSIQAGSIQAGSIQAGWFGSGQMTSRGPMYHTFVSVGTF